MTEQVRYGYGADRLKFFLMPLVCLMSFPIPSFFGSLLQSFTRFAPVCFYILSGFFVLVPEEEQRKEKLRRALRASGRFFALLFVCYFVLNAVWFSALGAPWVRGVFTKRRLFSFLVLCVWPFQTGESIWFIQSLFYAYVLLTLLDRFRLLRYADWIMLAAMLLMVLTGELAGVIHFRFLGYTYLPANALTRALPYLLLGGFLRQRAEQLFFNPPSLYLGLFALGFILVIAETLLLSFTGTLVYLGHMLGYILMGTSACCLALARPEPWGGRFFRHTRGFAKAIYALHQPVGMLLLLLAGFLPERAYAVIAAFAALPVFGLSLLLAWLTGRLRERLAAKNTV